MVLVTARESKVPKIWQTLFVHGPLSLSPSLLRSNGQKPIPNPRSLPSARPPALADAAADEVRVIGARRLGGGLGKAGAAAASI